MHARCGRCGATPPADASFCPDCGAPVGAGGGGPRTRAWALAAGAVVAVAVALALVLWRGQALTESRPTATIAAAAPGVATPAPDISRLTPRERFDRLYRRVMQAAGTGDTATTSRFMPMAIAAYEMLDSADADTRYHAAMLKLHAGDAAGARALADSMVRRDSSHLLGYVALGMAARFARDSAALPGIYAAFNARYDREIARKLPEYEEHRMMLGEFRSTAAGTAPRTSAARPGGT